MLEGKGLKILWDEIDKRDYEGIEGLSVEITEEEYDYSLEVLPPLKWNRNKGIFYMMEFLTGDLTTKLIKDKDKYYAEVVDFRKEFPQMSKQEYWRDYR